MTHYSWIVYALGFLSQFFFSARIVIQWFKSEKAHELVSPASYWIFSIIGAYLMLIYGWMRDDFSILAGQAISYYIYIWNMRDKGTWAKISPAIRWVLLLTPPVALAACMADGNFIGDFFQNKDIPLALLVFGTAAQMFFSLRYVYQFYLSKKAGKSVMPTAFWIWSSVGAGMILIYAIIRRDPVLVVGQGSGLVVYLREVMIGVRASRREK